MQRLWGSVMKNRRVRIIVAAVMSALLAGMLNGCGATQAVPAAEAGAASAGTYVDEEDDEAQEGENEDDSGLAQDALQNDEGLDEPEDVDEGLEEADVYNNGGYFVRVGEKTYFWQIAEEALPQDALFGNYHRSLKPTKVKSSLLCYDKKTGDISQIYSAVTNGQIFYGDGRLYLQRPFLNAKTQTYETQDYSIDLEGEDSRKGGYGEIQDVIEEQGVYITMRYEDGGLTYEVRSLRDDKVVNAYEVADQAYGNQYVTGTEDGFLVWHTESSDYYTMTLVPYSSKEKAVDLGAYEPDDMGIYYSPVQVEEEDEVLYISIEGRAGTANTYCDNDIVKVDLAEKRMSRAKVEKASIEDALLDEVNYFTVKDGEPVFSQQPHSEVFQMEIGGKHQILYRVGDQWEGVDSLERHDPEFGPCYAFTRENMELVEYTGDAIYAVVNDELRDPGRDVGWRYAYKPSRIRYIRVDTKTKEVMELASTEMPENRSTMAYVWLLDKEEASIDSVHIAFCPMYMVTAADQDLMEKYDLTEDDLFNDYSLEFAETGRYLYTAELDPDLAFAGFTFVQDADGYETLRETNGDMNLFFDRVWEYEQMNDNTNNCHLEVSELTDEYAGASLPKERFNPEEGIAPIFVKLIWNEDGTKIASIEELYRP